MRNADLELKPGDELPRTAIHEAFGGQRQSGISPSSKTGYIMIFSMPPSPSNPYTDGWFDDGYFHYTGEGQVGDQVMKRGNKALRDHVQDNKSVHLFEGHAKGKPVGYIGELSLVDYSTVDGFGSDGQMRSQFRFRFAPASGGPAEIDLPIQPSPIAEINEVSEVPVEQHLTESYDLARTATPSENQRREAKLVAEYSNYLGHARLVRQRILVQGAIRPIYTDLYDIELGRLIEAKGSTSRSHVRMAIGQLLDYSRFFETTPTLAVLLPSEPSPDLLQLLANLNITTIWKVAEGKFLEHSRHDN